MAKSRREEKPPMDLDTIPILHNLIERYGYKGVLDSIQSFAAADSLYGEHIRRHYLDQLSVVLSMVCNFASLHEL